jgi:hypothetical protein
VRHSSVSFSVVLSPVLLASTAFAQGAVSGRVTGAVVTMQCGAPSPSPAPTRLESERRRLDAYLRCGRADTTAKRLMDIQFAGVYRNTFRNPFGQLLRNADTLRLNDDQADHIALLNRDFSRATDRIWSPISMRLAALPVQYDLNAAWKDIESGYTETLTILTACAASARAVLTDAQWTIVAPPVKQLLEPNSIRGMHPVAGWTPPPGASISESGRGAGGMGARRLQPTPSGC